MSTITVVTGGASSGKTRWAINYFAACDNVLYIHTDKELSEDIKRRIEYNNSKNDVMWDIREDVKEPLELVKDHKFFIFDGLVSYTRQVIKRECDDAAQLKYEQKKRIEKQIIDEVQSMIACVEKVHGDMVIITVETGFSLPSDDKALATEREIIGFVNQRIANIAQEVYLSASGIQFRIR